MLKKSLSILAIGMIGGFISSTINQSPVLADKAYQDTVSARSFQVVDAFGKLKAELTSAGNKTILTFKTENGANPINMVVDDNGDAQISVGDPKNTNVLLISEKSEKGIYLVNGKGLTLSAVTPNSEENTATVSIFKDKKTVWTSKK